MLAYMEKSIEPLIRSLSERPDIPPELDDIYTLALQLENEIAFLLASINRNR